ncbi:Wzz/FepE/Etk N-terminal domain-containing protein [uncultured Cyclobacterium sp.]|uniref:GumC family protein n=1 Tax=uncultured Cyclobacterium sp. TaxID=453820 RepID=UPI0030EBFA34|tara:strand:- start:140821 stop:142962 length:2142 start_codon:yes stop_codon:yes gene_type:complete
MTLKQLIRLLWKNKLWIFLTPIFVAVGVFFLTQDLPRVYESSTLVFTNPTSDRGATDGGVVRMDFYTSNNLFDNLTLIVKSRKTIKESSLKLLAKHLALPEQVDEVLCIEAYQDLKSHIPPQVWEKLAVINDEEKTYQNILENLEENDDSPIEYLIREHEYYSVNKIIERLSVSRKFSSDMMEIKYNTNDAGICYYTLKIVAESFMSGYSNMKELENTNTIAYFQNQLNIAQNKLRNAEENLKGFMTDNRILNYYEQGKYLDIAKLEHDQDEERSKRLLSGTGFNLEQIEEMFENFDQRQVIIKNISALQDQIVTRNLKIQGLSVLTSQSQQIENIQKEIEGLEEEIKELSDQLFKNNNSIQGVQRETILDQWLTLKISYQEQKQALDVMKTRKSYLLEKIDEFAPLGAELKKLEREVSVNEEQYLSILHGLNMAYLQKYDLEMSATQKLIDAPYYPKTPQASKRMFMVIGGMIGTGGLVLTVVLLTFFLDSSIKSSKRATELTNLQVAGGWIMEKNIPKNVYLDKLRNNQIKQFYNNLSKHFPSSKQKILLFYSHQNGEGKTFLLQFLANELLQQNRSVLYCGNKEDTEKMSCETLVMETDSISNPEKETQFWENQLTNLPHEFILIELPNTNEKPLNYPLINQANALVMVTDASRKWKSSDNYFNDTLKEMIKIPHLIWLNKMNGDELEDINGEIPRKRSPIRAKLKRFLT